MTMTCPVCGESYVCSGCAELEDLRRRSEAQVLALDRGRCDWQRQRATIDHLEGRLRLYEGAQP